MRTSNVIRTAVALAAIWIVTLDPVRAAETAPFAVPDEITMPSGPDGAAVNLGKALVTETKKRLPRNVGNGLNCSSCHLGAGTVALAGPFVGLWGVFPEYRARGGAIDSLQERINDCFLRSMNGKPLAWDSAEMNAMLMYIRWLSTGVPTGTPVAGRGMGSVDTTLKPNAVHGKQIYAEKCASCHGAGGAGIANPAGGYVFPPVWGNASFNVGAGMARTYTAAALHQAQHAAGARQHAQRPGRDRRGRVRHASAAPRLRRGQGRLRERPQAQGRAQLGREPASGAGRP